VTTRKLTFLQYYFCNLCQRTPSKQKSFDDTTKEQKQIKAYIYMSEGYVPCSKKESSKPENDDTCSFSSQ